MEKDFIEGVMANGMRFIAGTDVGTKELDKYGGVRSNEDRVVVNPQKNEITVIDGMGGHAGGSVAAQIIAEIALSEEGDVQDRVLKAAAALREAADPSKGYEGLRVYSDSGAVLAHVRMISKNEAEVSWIGDASVMVLRGKEVFYASQDHAVVSEMVRKGTISEDQALVYLGRNDPGRAIQAGNTEHLVESERVSGLQPGDLILIMSDGISDNLTPEEIAEIIAPAENIQSAYKNVVLKSRARMEFSKNDRSIVSAQTAARRNGVMDKYSDGFRSQPKQDDRSFAIIEVPKK